MIYPVFRKIYVVVFLSFVYCKVTFLPMLYNIFILILGPLTKSQGMSHGPFGK